MSRAPEALQPDRSRPSARRAREAVAPSLLQTAYDEIKRLIVTCAYRPGEYLNEAEVSATLGIGRTPVHQALDRLRVEGMVEVMARKGTFVKPVSLDQALQTVEIRLLNEVHGVRLAATRATAAEIGEMEAILDRARAELPGRNVEALMGLDREFHGVVARASRNVVLAELLGRLHDSALRFWVISLTAPGHHAAVQAQHTAILDAIRARNPDRAGDAMCEHIEAFRRNLLQTI